MAKHDDSSKGKPKRDSKNLSLTPVARPGKNLDHSDMEKLLRETGQRFKTRRRSLRQLRPEIEIIRAYFKEHVRGSVTLGGCRSFKECCPKFFGCGEQAVYSMLGDYPQKLKERKYSRDSRGIKHANLVHAAGQDCVYERFYKLVHLFSYAGRRYVAPPVGR